MIIAFYAQLDDVFPQGLEKRIALAKQTLEALLKRVAYDQLSRDGLVNYEMLRDALHLELWSEEHERPWQRDPRGYTSIATEWAYALLTQSTLPKAQNIANVIARVKQVPAMIAQVRLSLKNPTTDPLTPRPRTKSRLNWIRTPQKQFPSSRVGCSSLDGSPKGVGGDFVGADFDEVGGGGGQRE